MLVPQGPLVPASCARFLCPTYRTVYADSAWERALALRRAKACLLPARRKAYASPTASSTGAAASRAARTVLLAVAGTGRTGMPRGATVGASVRATLVGRPRPRLGAPSAATRASALPMPHCGWPRSRRCGSHAGWVCCIVRGGAHPAHGVDEPACRHPVQVPSERAGPSPAARGGMRAALAGGGSCGERRQPAHYHPSSPPGAGRAARGGEPSPPGGGYADPDAGWHPGAGRGVARRDGLRPCGARSTRRPGHGPLPRGARLLRWRLSSR